MPHNGCGQARLRIIYPKSLGLSGQVMKNPVPARQNTAILLGCGYETVLLQFYFLSTLPMRKK
jgi:hypothetical protein